MSGSITGSYTSNVTLVSNPSTITQTATISGTTDHAIGVIGPAGTDWTLTNLGTVSETGSYSVGISFANAGTIINGGEVNGNLTTRGAGIMLAGGGVITNQAVGTISGLNGVYAAAGAVTLLNAGSIVGNASLGSGVNLKASGSITNQSGGVITGDNGIIAASGTVMNAGSIYSNLVAGFGIELLGAGLVSNQFGGVISGYDGVVGGSSADVVVNAGAIRGNATAAGGKGIFAGGSVTNQSGGTVSGQDGLYLLSAGTVTNAGSIGGNTANGIGAYLRAGGTLTNQSGGTISGGADAVKFGAGHTSRLVVAPSAGFTGKVDGGNTIGAASISTLELASGASAGTLAGLGSSFVNFAQITVDSGATWRLSGTNTGFATLSNAGSLQSGVALGSGSFTVSNVSGGTISNTATSGTALTASGTLAVVNAGLVAGGTSTGVGVYLGGTGGGALTNQAGGTITGGSYAVRFTGGAITNQASAVISGAQSGIDGASNALTVVNAGQVIGSRNAGIVLAHGGAVTNQSRGTISSGGGTVAAAVVGQGSAVTVINAGVIAGTSTKSSDVILRAGGVVTNQSGGTITSNYIGVKFISAAATLVNAGLLTASGLGVYLAAGGAVSNQAGGTIASTTLALEAANSAVAVFNAGIIAGGTTAVAHGANTYEDAGAYFAKGGSLTNQAGGTVSGFVAFVAGGGAATVTNYGVIRGANAGFYNTSAHASFYAAGIYLLAGGGVTNQSGGTISGQFGVLGYGAALSVVNAGVILGAGSKGAYLSGGGTLTNQAAGSITGGTDAVKFGASHTNRLVIDPSASFSGIVDGGNTVGAASISTLELASGASVGTLSGLGSHYVNFAQATIDANAAWTLSGTNTLASGTTLTNGGRLTNAGTFGDTGVLVNNGSILVDPGMMTIGTLIGTGSLTIDANGTLVMTGTVGGNETISFAGGAAYLDLLSPTSISGNVSNFALGGTIDLKGIDPGSVSYSGGELQFDGTNAFALSLAGGSTLQITGSADGAELTALCFCINTMIATPRGEVKVQDLVVGDLVTTLSGAASKIEWIGTGAVLATRGRRNPATPVIVRKGALANNVPHRDLHVTKGHSLYLDDVLIPVEFLVNHRSIVWDDQAQEVHLYHIELDRHDVLLANGAPAESYRDDGNRWLFQNGNSRWSQPPKPPCAPVLTDGPIVDAAWRRLLDRSGARASLPLTEDPDLHMWVAGARLDAADRSQGTYVFTLPNILSDIRIVSRAASPQELGLARDPRCLGVALRQIILRRRAWFRIIEASEALLTNGFHAFEPDNGFRWTDGEAVLPMELLGRSTRPLEIVIPVGSTALYIEERTTSWTA